MDDQNKAQATPGAADLTLGETFKAALAVSSFSVEQNLAERSYIRYLDVNFNQVPSGLAGGLKTSPGQFVELLWYGKAPTPATSPQGTVNLFGPGTTALVTLSGTDLSIDFGKNGITSLLTESGVPGTGSPKTTFGDGWFALGIDPKGDPSQGQVVWLPFFRLLGDTNGDKKVDTTDINNVNGAFGSSGALLEADVNGDGGVNALDRTEASSASNAKDTVGANPPTNFPAFQIFAGPAAGPGSATPVTQADVRALLPRAIAAWQAAGLDTADLRRLSGVGVTVSNLGSTILGFETPGLVTINQTAAGHAWSLASSGPVPAGRVDLLTVLEHELGHVLSLPDDADPTDLMDTTLGLGVRRSPTAQDVGEVLAASGIATTIAAPPLTGESSPLRSSSIGKPARFAAHDAALATIAGPARAGGPPQGAVAPPVNTAMATPGVRPEVQIPSTAARLARPKVKSLFHGRITHPASLARLRHRGPSPAH